MKKIISALLSALTAASLTLTTFGCSTDKKIENTTASVNLDINPSIELVVDGKGIVVAVRGVNDDGVTLLYGEDGIIGVDVQIAVEKITSIAVDLGYISDGRNQVVDTTVNADGDKLSASVTAKVNAGISAAATESGIEIEASAEGSYSLNRQLEELKKQYPDDKVIQSLTIAKFRLALSVSQTCDISIEAAVRLSNSELLSKLEAADKAIEAYATDAYLAAKKQALAAYDKAVELKALAVYGQYYLTHMTEHPATCYYGAAYQMYASARLGLNTVADLIEASAKVSDYELDEKQVKAVLDALGLEDADVELLKKDGKITIASVEAYADKYFKNSPAGEALELKKRNLSQAIANAEAEIKPVVSKIAEEYKTWIEAQTSQSDVIVNGLKPVLESMKNFATLNPAINNIISDIDEMTEDYEALSDSVKALLNGDTATVEQLRTIADGYGTIADKYLQKIESDLSEEEKKTIETNRKAVIDACAQERQTLENAMDDAAKAAKDWIKRVKEELKNKTAD